MPYKIEIIDANVQATVYTGEITFEDYQNATIEGFELGQKNNIERFLSHHVNAVSDISVTEIFAIPGLYDEIGADRRYKLALVADENDKRLKDYQFFETASQNRGFNVMIFHTKNDALAWLKE